MVPARSFDWIEPSSIFAEFTELMAIFPRVTALSLIICVVIIVVAAPATPPSATNSAISATIIAGEGNFITTESYRLCER
jgi:hypothetical protein